MARQAPPPPTLNTTPNDVSRTLVKARDIMMLLAFWDGAFHKFRVCGLRRVERWFWQIKYQAALLV